MNTATNGTELFIQLGPFYIRLHWMDNQTELLSQWFDKFYANFMLTEEQWKQSENRFEIDVYNESNTDLGVAGCSVITLDRDLRKWVSLQARVKGGFSVHSAGAIIDGRGVLMPGVSGAGKTTLVTKLEPSSELVLSDDRCVILPMADGHWKIWGTPFYGTGRQGITGPGVPLEAILFPSKKPVLRVVPVDIIDAIPLFLKATVVPKENRNGKELTDAMQLVSSVKCFKVEYSLEQNEEVILDSINKAL